MLRNIAVFLTALLFASCTITKDIKRQKTETFSEVTTSIDTTVTVNVQPIHFYTSIDSIKSLFDTTFVLNPIVDTLVNGNGDVLKVTREGKNLYFEVVTKPIPVKVTAKKVEKTHIIQKTVEKHKKKSLSLLYYSMAIIALLSLYAFRKRIFI